MSWDENQTDLPGSSAKGPGQNRHKNCCKILRLSKTGGAKQSVQLRIVAYSNFEERKKSYRNKIEFIHRSLGRWGQ